jgi:hypothetical protein
MAHDDYPADLAFRKSPYATTFLALCAGWFLGRMRVSRDRRRRSHLSSL